MASVGFNRSMRSPVASLLHATSMYGNAKSTIRKICFEYEMLYDTNLSIKKVFIQFDSVR